MKPSLELYHTYKLVNKLLVKSLKKEIGLRGSIRLSPLRFMLNRTHYSYWVKGVEQISIKLHYPVSLNELYTIERTLLSQLNMILQCVDMDNFKEVKNVDVVVN